MAKPFCYLKFFLFLLLLLSGKAYANSINPGHLKIVLTNPPAAGKKKAKGDAKAKSAGNWKKACNSLGQAFLLNKNAFGHGIMQSYACFSKDKPVPGEKNASKEADWLLKISTSESGQWQFDMFYQAEETPQARVEVPGKDQMLKALEDPAVHRMLAFQIMDSLPMARTMEGDRKKKSMKITETASTGLPPVKKYNIFTLEYLPSQKLWIPKMAGTATLKGAGKGTKKKGKEDEEKSEENAQGASHTYTVRWQVEPEKDKTYWAQNAEGRGAKAGEVEKTLGGALAKHGISYGLFDQAAAALLDTLAGGYVGFRYGYPMTKGDNIITKAAMVGILTEVRGGPLKGLRWYWDFAPKTKDAINGTETEYTWSRPTLGWSIGLDMDSFITRIDLVPKLGLMDFDATFPVESNGQTVAKRFRLKNASNFGGELGIETGTPWFLIRTWAASDISGVLDLGGSGTVTSLRGGVDTFWNFYKISDYFDLTVLVFAFGERLTLATGDKEEEDPNELRIEQVSFNMAFLGAGLVLTW